MARGMIRKRGLVWYIAYPYHGKKKWEAVGPKKKEAERLLAARLEGIRTGTFRELRAITFGQMADKWLERKVGIKASTADAYQSIIRVHLKPRFGRKPLATITTDEIQGFISGLARKGLSDKSVVNVLVVLSRMLRDAVRWGHLNHNPAHEVEKPRIQRKEIRLLDPDQVRQLLDQVPEIHYPLFLTYAMCGLRRGEALALKWEDIDWRGRVIRVRRSLYRGRFVDPKTRHARREVELPDRLATVLKREFRLRGMRSPLGLVFCSDSGAPLDPDNLVKRVFHPALRAAGLPRIRLHDLRHIYASLLIAQGESIKKVETQMGHASAQTTLDLYGHLFPRDRGTSATRVEQALFGRSGTIG